MFILLHVDFLIGFKKPHYSINDEYPTLGSLTRFSVDNFKKKELLLKHMKHLQAQSFLKQQASKTSHMNHPLLNSPHELRVISYESNFLYFKLYNIKNLMQCESKVCLIV